MYPTMYPTMYLPTHHHVRVHTHAFIPAHNQTIKSSIIQTKPTHNHTQIPKYTDLPDIPPLLLLYHTLPYSAIRYTTLHTLHTIYTHPKYNSTHLYTIHTYIHYLLYQYYYTTYIHTNTIVPLNYSIQLSRHYYQPTTAYPDYQPTSLPAYQPTLPNQFLVCDWWPQLGLLGLQKRSELLLLAAWTVHRLFASIHHSPQSARLDSLHHHHHHHQRNDPISQQNKRQPKELATKKSPTFPSFTPRLAKLL